MYYNAGRVTERPSLPQTDGVWWRLAHVAAGFPISCDFSSFHPRAVVPSWPHILFSHFLVNGPVWDGPGSAACSCVVSACVCADTCWYSVLLSCTHTHTHTQEKFDCGGCSTGFLCWLWAVRCTERRRRGVGESLLRMNVESDSNSSSTAAGENCYTTFKNDF